MSKPKSPDSKSTILPSPSFAIVPTPEQRYNQASNLIADGNIQMAEVILIKLQSQQNQHFSALAKQKLKLLDNYKSALGFLEEGDIENYANILLEIGEQNLDRHMKDLAQTKLQQILEHKKASPLKPLEEKKDVSLKPLKDNYLIGEQCYNKGQYDLAFGYFLNSVRAGNNKAVSALLDSAFAVIKQTGSEDIAIEYLEQCQLYSQFAAHRLAKLYTRKNNWKKALEIYERNLSNPAKPYIPSIVELGIYYHSIGNHEKAFDYLKRLIEIESPTDPETLLYQDYNRGLLLLGDYYKSKGTTVPDFLAMSVKCYKKVELMVDDKAESRAKFQETAKLLFNAAAPLREADVPTPKAMEYYDLLAKFGYEPAQKKLKELEEIASVKQIAGHEDFARFEEELKKRPSEYKESARKVGKLEESEDVEEDSIEEEKDEKEEEEDKKQEKLTQEFLEAFEDFKSKNSSEEFKEKLEGDDKKEDYKVRSNKLAAAPKENYILSLAKIEINEIIKDDLIARISSDQYLTKIDFDQCIISDVFLTEIIAALKSEDDLTFLKEVNFGNIKDRVSEEDIAKINEKISLNKELFSLPEKPYSAAKPVGASLLASPQNIEQSIV